MPSRFTFGVGVWHVRVIGLSDVLYVYGCGCTPAMGCSSIEKWRTLCVVRPCRTTMSNFNRVSLRGIYSLEAEGLVGYAMKNLKVSLV